MMLPYNEVTQRWHSPTCLLPLAGNVGFQDPTPDVRMTAAGWEADARGTSCFRKSLLCLRP
jgi:hypothetical protein